MAYSILVSAKGPLVLGLGLKGLGIRVDNVYKFSFNKIFFKNELIFDDLVKNI